ncbi:MAG TPA: zf-HC2 domain-containing protein [Acidobacteriota bacterium]|nr:zf-HC2 domain-containing protein [Acidobacteriota bacterium]
MNCRSAEPLLLAERDGVLTPAQHADLVQHVAACASCRQLRTDLATAMDAVRVEAQAVPLPDIDAEWRAVEAKINGNAAAGTAHHKRRLAPIVWFSAPLAAAAAVALALFVNRPVPVIPSEGVIAARADFVEVADPKATPIVYTDKESGWLVVWAESADTTHASG